MQASGCGQHGKAFLLGEGFSCGGSLFLVGLQVGDLVDVAAWGIVLWDWGCVS